jgi:DNA-binding CsgD family transcriptional regulator
MSRSAAWLAQHPASTDLRVLDEPFFMSDLYNLVWRHFGQDHCIHAPITQEGMTIGMLGLFRPSHQKPFDSDEQALCMRLLPYVAHALREEGKKTPKYGEAGLPSMMVMDTQGTVHYLCHTAKKLLALASHAALTSDTRKEAVLLAKLAQLCCNLDMIFRGKQADPPSWFHINGRGRFIFRARWLDDHNQASCGLIGMSIEHQEPLLLKILRALQHLPLSPVQKEVAVMLAQGASSETIGAHLHIKLTTVKDHIRKIFTKLDIEHREELLPKLLALEKSTQLLMPLP